MGIEQTKGRDIFEAVHDEQEAVGNLRPDGPLAFFLGEEVSHCSQLGSLCLRCHEYHAVNAVDDKSASDKSLRLGSTVAMATTFGMGNGSIGT